MFLAIINISVFIMGMFLHSRVHHPHHDSYRLPDPEAAQHQPIHFGILMTINMELAFLTPPVGMHLFVMSAVCKEPVHEW